MLSLQIEAVGSERSEFPGKTRLRRRGYVSEVFRFPASLQSLRRWLARQCAGRCRHVHRRADTAPQESPFPDTGGQHARRPVCPGGQRMVSPPAWPRSDLLAGLVTGSAAVVRTMGSPPSRFLAKRARRSSTPVRLGGDSGSRQRGIQLDHRHPSPAGSAADHSPITGLRGAPFYFQGVARLSRSETLIFWSSQDLQVLR